MMNTFRHSLRGQFLIGILLVLFVTAAISGGIQLSFMKKQIAEGTDNQAMIITHSLNNGIQETILATTAIEHQIDKRLISQMTHIADLLKGRPLNAIEESELVAIKDSLGLTGISLLAAQNDDIQTVKSTEAQDIGFSLKAVGFMEAGQALLDGKKPEVPGSTSADINLVVLPIAQSVSHAEKPVFYKYAYYHSPGTDYFLSAYLEAGEVYQFTNQTGTDAWITKMKEENHTILEIGILTPKVFADPSLAEKLYPPVKQVVHGSFDFRTEKDEAVLKELEKKPEKITYIQEMNGNKIYKQFLPINENEVMYLSLDYDRLSAPLYRHSIVLILSGFISLIAMVLLTIHFFNRIYKDIKQISNQIHSLESRDFTVKSSLKGHGELAVLSNSTNQMAATLNTVLQGTNIQAMKIEQLSRLLEEESNESVERVYALSMETTTNERYTSEELYDFLSAVEQQLESEVPGQGVQPIIQRIESLREMIRNRTQSTTEITITLSDLLQSLHAQSKELAGISSMLHQQMALFKLENNDR